MSVYPAFHLGEWWVTRPMEEAMSEQPVSEKDIDSAWFEEGPVSALDKLARRLRAERDLLADKWKQMEAYGFDSPKHVFDRLATVERERDEARRLQKDYAADIIAAKEVLAEIGIVESTAESAAIKARDAILDARRLHDEHCDDGEEAPWRRP